MDYSVGALAIFKQQDLLREAAKRNRDRIAERDLALGRQREPAHGVRRLLHR